MSISSLIPPLSLGRRRNLSLDEIETLLEILPQTSLLLDLANNQILLANSKATELTAFTRAELADLPIDHLLPGLSEKMENVIREGDEDQLPGQILLRNGSQAEIFISLKHLDAGSYIVATIDSVFAYQEEQAEHERQASRLDDILSLCRATQEQNIHSALENALQVSKDLTGASMSALYLGDPKAPGLQRRISFGSTEGFPERISPKELEHLIEPAFWILGRRVTTSLHKHARVSDFSYLATSPLGRSEAVTGLIVIADNELNPPQDIIPLLQILTSTIATIIQRHALSTNSVKAQNNERRAQTINDCIFENIQEGAIILSADLKIYDMNPSAEWMLGYATREVTNQPVENIIIGAENLVSALQVAQDGITTPNLGNIRLHRRDGSTFLSHLHIEPLMIDDNFNGAILLLRDLSEREEIEERNQQLEQRAILGEVTSIFAHEVRNPLNNLSTGLQLMARNLPEDDPNQELIDQSDEDINRIIDLIESTLEFARPKETKMEPVDLAILLARLLNRWHPRLARLNVVPQFETPDDDPIVTADPRALEQVFSNLIGNALDAMSEEGGTLGICIRAIDSQNGRNEIEISISDTGPGIPEEARERIFEPFFTTKTKKGTGLGLAIAKRIVTRHNGTLDVNSVPGGSVFLVNLPASNNRRTQQ